MYTGNPFQMDFGDSHAEKGYYIVDTDTLKTEFYPNSFSPQHEKVLLSWLISNKTIDKRVTDIITNNIVKFVVDRRASAEDSEYIFTKLKQLNPQQFNVEIEFTNNFSLEEEKQDLSGVDIKQAIIEYIDMMDINNKHEIQTYMLELYDKI